MHALAVSVQIDSGKEEDALQELRNNVVPRVKQAPGIVNAYWMEPGGGYGYAILLFDSEENANAGKQMAENAPRPDFIKLTTAQVMEVIESV